MYRRRGSQCWTFKDFFKVFLWCGLTAKREGGIIWHEKLKSSNLQPLANCQHHVMGTADMLKKCVDKKLSSKVSTVWLTVLLVFGCLETSIATQPPPTTTTIWPYALHFPAELCPWQAFVRQLTLLSLHTDNLLLMPMCVLLHCLCYSDKNHAI